MDLCRMLDESDMDFQVKGNVRRKVKEEETKERKKKEREKIKGRKLEEMRELYGEGMSGKVRVSGSDMWTSGLLFS